MFGALGCRVVLLTWSMNALSGLKSMAGLVLLLVYQDHKHSCREHMHMHTYAHTCTHMHTHADMQTHAHTWPHMYAHTCTHMQFAQFKSFLSSGVTFLCCTTMSVVQQWIAVAEECRPEPPEQDPRNPEEDEDVKATVEELFLCLSQVEGVKADLQKMRGVLTRHIKRAEVLNYKSKQAVKLAKHWQAACQQQRAKFLKEQAKSAQLETENQEHKSMHQKVVAWFAQTPLFQDCHDSGGRTVKSKWQAAPQPQVGQVSASGCKHRGLDHTHPMLPSPELNSRYLVRAFKSQSHGVLGAQDRPIGQGIDQQFWKAYREEHNCSGEGRTT